MELACPVCAVGDRNNCRPGGRFLFCGQGERCVVKRDDHGPDALVLRAGGEVV